MGICCCMTRNEYESNPDGARIYTLQEILERGLQRSALVCPICGTMMYTYANKSFKHYPNQPHTNKICVEMSSANRDYDRKNFDIDKFVAKLTILRKIKVKKASPVLLPYEEQNIGTTLDKLTLDDILDTPEEELVSLLNPEINILQETTNQKDDSKKDDVSSVISDEIEDDPLLLIWEDYENEIEQKRKAAEQEKMMKGQVEGQLSLFDMLETEEPIDKVMPLEIEPEEIKIVQIKNIPDLYKAGFFQLKALNVIHTDEDGTEHYAYESVISKKNWRYIFGKRLFNGGARAIELYYDRYHEGRYLYDEHNQRYVDKSYVVFKSSFKTYDESQNNEKWNNVRFLIYFAEENDYQAFLGEYLKYDGEKGCYVEKEKGKLYCVSGVFQKVDKDFCEEHCFWGYLKNYKNKTEYCESCCQQFKCQITNMDKQIDYAIEVD